MFKAVKKPIAIGVVTYEEILSYGSHQVSTEYSVKMDAVLSSLVLTFDLDTGDVTQVTVKTREGELLMTDNDYLIIGVFGEVYPIGKEIFEATYDVLPQGDSDES